MGRARAAQGAASGGGAGGFRAGPGAAARSAPLALQLLRWHLQDCGGFSGPLHCGAGWRGREPRHFPTQLATLLFLFHPNLGAVFQQPGWIKKKKKRFKWLYL